MAIMTDKIYNITLYLYSSFLFDFNLSSASIRFLFVLNFNASMITSIMSSSLLYTNRRSQYLTLILPTIND